MSRYIEAKAMDQLMQNDCTVVIRSCPVSSLIPIWSDDAEICASEKAVPSRTSLKFINSSRMSCGHSTVHDALRKIV
eukprot:SAG31_NODE_1063_length_10105_cov_4.370778_3_plen_77_part_00